MGNKIEAIVLCRWKYIIRVNVSPFEPPESFLYCVSNPKRFMETFTKAKTRIYV